MDGEDFAPRRLRAVGARARLLHESRQQLHALTPRRTRRGFLPGRTCFARASGASSTSRHRGNLAVDARGQRAGVARREGITRPASGALVTSAAFKGLYTLDAATGRLKWSRTPSALSPQPIVSGGLIYSAVGRQPLRGTSERVARFPYVRKDQKEGASGCAAATNRVQRVGMSRRARRRGRKMSPRVRGRRDRTPRTTKEAKPSPPRPRINKKAKGRPCSPTRPASAENINPINAADGRQSTSGSFFAPLFTLAPHVAARRDSLTSTARRRARRHSSLSNASAREKISALTLGKTRRISVQFLSRIFEPICRRYCRRCTARGLTGAPRRPRAGVWADGAP